MKGLVPMLQGHSLLIYVDRDKTYYIRRPLLARGHQTAKAVCYHFSFQSFQYSITNWLIAMVCRSAICYSWYLQVCRSAIWCCYWYAVPPWINNLPSKMLMLSSWGGPENQSNFKLCPIHLKITKMASQDPQKCPKRNQNWYLKSLKKSRIFFNSNQIES